MTIYSEDFILGLHSKEKVSFQLLFDTFHKSLCFFAAKIIRDVDAAEDIVQDVFVAFWNMDLVGFPNVKTVKTFLYNSVQNRSINFLRDVNMRERNHLLLPLNEEDNDHYIYQQIKTEVVAEIFQAINELPDRCKEIFNLAYIQNKEDKQIAEMLNISLNTIKTQKQRAKTYLRGRLGELFIFAGIFFPGI